MRRRTPWERRERLTSRCVFVCVVAGFQGCPRYSQISSRLLCTSGRVNYITSSCILCLYASKSTLTHMHVLAVCLLLPTVCVPAAG